MRKFFIFFLLLNILYGLSFGQNKYVLKGTVVDEKKQPLVGASIYLYPIKKGTFTDVQGNFLISDLISGIYRIEISFIGYKSTIDTLKINGNIVFNAQLSVSSVKLQEVVITDNYIETRKKEDPLNIEIVNDDYLKQHLGGSLMKSLERLSGVSAIDIGQGQSKPVIRGLGFNRIVVIENSIKHEAQQWGADHGLEIDQYAVENIEVIKGPASLMYGSDAIGGVINMKSKKIPADSTIGGTIDFFGKTNNDNIGTSISLYGRKKWFFTDVRATILGYGDYKVPTDSVDIYSYRAALYKNHLRNTAGKEQNLHVSFGMIQPRFQCKFYISNIQIENGFFANAHGLEPRHVDTELHDQSNRDINDPYQQVNHFKIINLSHYLWEKSKLECDLGYQRNFRQEWSQYVNHGYMPPVFPDSLSFHSGLEHQFEKYVYSVNIKYSYNLSDKTQGIIGMNSEYQDNRINGRSFIIPAYTQLITGAYAFGKYAFSEKSIVQFGVRYGYGAISSREYNDWFPSPIVKDADTTLQYLKRANAMNRNFSNFSWSVGYNYNPEKWTVKANFGKSFRMPIPKELAANGVNYHHFSYEVGNAGLSPEISYQLDAGMEYSSKKLAIEATPFLNYFSNYIYLNPSSEHDRLYGNGNQVFYYTQCEVFRYGAEIHAHYQVLKFLQLGIIGEYVYSEQLSGQKKGFSLPFSPPASAIFNIKYQKQRILFFDNPYLSVDYRLTAKQNNIVPPEETTHSYQVINLSFGGYIKFKNQQVVVSLQVHNLLNTNYFNHASYYRLINVPEPGRNFIVNISIPFSGKLKKIK